MRVLVATGGSPDAKAAVKWLLRFPLPRATEVLVLAVAPVPHSPLDPEAMREMREASRARARRVCERAPAPAARGGRIRRPHAEHCRIREPFTLPAM